MRALHALWIALIVLLVACSGEDTCDAARDGRSCGMTRPYSFTESRAAGPPSVGFPSSNGVDVLYTNQANTVSGTCAPGSTITVQLVSGAGTTTFGAAVVGGAWTTSLSPADADLGDAALVVVQSLGGQTNSSSTAVSVAELQPAGAAVGPFSDVNRWAGAAGDGPDEQNSRTMIVDWWSTDITITNQYLWGFNSATTGWFLWFGSAQDIYLYHRGGSPGIRLIANVYRGNNTLAITKTSGGVLRWSCNGGVSRSLTSPGTYTAGGASAVHAFGYNAAESVYPATQQSLLWTAVIDAELTDAGLQTASGGSNLLARWQPAPIVSGHASLRWLWRAEDWDGSSATFAGSGSSPYTMTRVGSGGGKRVFPAYKRYSIPASAVWDSSQQFTTGVTGVTTGFRRSIYATTRFISDAADASANGPAGIAVDNMVSTWNAVAWPAQVESGVNIDGVVQQANHNGLVPYPGILQVEGYGLVRGMDSPGVPAGASKQFELVDGFQTTTGAKIGTGGTSLRVRVPATSALNWVRRAAPERQIVCMFDSLGEEIENLPVTPGTNNPTSKAWPILLRNHAAAAGWGRVAADGWGSATWYQRISTAPLRATTVATMQGLGIGTVQNVFLFALGTNDYGLPSAYASAAQLQSDLTAYAQELLAAGIPGTIIYFIGPTSRLNESINNANGYNIPDVRAAESNAAAATGDSRARYLSAAAWVSLANRTDSQQLHWNLAGHVEFVTNVEAGIALF